MSLAGTIQDIRRHDFDPLRPTIESHLGQFRARRPLGWSVKCAESITFIGN